MKRITFAKRLAALLLGAAVFASSVDAMAQEHGRGRYYGGGYGSGRLYEVQAQERGRGRYDAPRPTGRYNDARRGQDERVRGRPAMRAVPVVPLPGRGQGWRRGQYLPPNLRGYRVPDLGRYRLRAPPPGYDWVPVGPDIYLVQRNSGLVLDAVPGGY